MSTIYSSWSSVAYGSGTGSFCYLKDPIDPTRNIVLYITGDEFSWTTEVDRGVFNSLGRSTPIVVTDVVKAMTSNFTAYVLTAADEAAFDLLFNSMRALLLQLPDGRQWYINILTIQKKLPPGAGAFVLIDMSVVEVAEPS